jgi:hypothetical protein
VSATELDAKHSAVVPANAGTHTAESIKGAGGEYRESNRSLGLWVPAFAGTTLWVGLAMTVQSHPAFSCLKLMTSS